MAVRALELYRQGDCNNAVPVLQALLDRQPKNVSSRKLLAQCLLKQKKWEDARAQFEWVLRDSPKDIDAANGVKSALTQLQKVEQVSQARIIESRVATAEQLRSKHELDRVAELIKAGKMAEAEQILQPMIAQHPTWITPRQRLAELYSASNRFPEAADIYRSLAAGSVAPAVFLKRAAQNFEWGEKYEDAIKDYRAYLEHQPRDYSARMSLAQILVHEQQYRQAVQELQGVLRSKPDLLPAQILLAQCYEQLEQPELALAAYDRVLQLDPNNTRSRQARDRWARYFDELPLRRGFEALDNKDWQTAVREFAKYLEKHPDDSETVLRIAHVYSAQKDFANARVYYDRYLQKNPADMSVRRELANMEMWAQNYPAARHELHLLTSAPGATVADHEALIQTYVWSGELTAAEPYARQLLKLQPGNALATQTLQDILERRKYEARQQADRLVADRRFPEAIAAYRQYMADYGSDKPTQLLICRLHSWGRDFVHAATCYQEYLILNPEDDAVRLELADVLNWSGRYTEAELQYRKLLQADPNKTQARLGLAQTLEARNEDPVKVERAFRDVLRVDPANTVAQQRAADIRPRVAPTLELSHISFSDTDGLYWALDSVAVSITPPGRVKLTPYYLSGYFRQQRTVSGSSPEIAALNQKITQEGGVILANGGGLRIETHPNPRWSFAADIGALHLETGRTSPSGSAELVYRPSTKRSFGATYIHREAIYDLWTLPTLAAGIVGDTALVSTQQMFGDKWRLGVQGGFTRYSRGTDAQFLSNTQRRVWAQLDYPVLSWMRLGYVLHLSSFTTASPIYFSPELYQTHGMSYAIEHTWRDRLRFTTAGELNYSRIDQRQSFEMSLLPAVSWKLGGGFILDIGYRFSLGRVSVFGQPTYRTQGGEVHLRKVF